MARWKHHTGGNGPVQNPRRTKAWTMGDHKNWSNSRDEIDGQNRRDGRCRRNVNQQLLCTHRPITAVCDEKTRKAPTCNEKTGDDG